MRAFLALLLLASSAFGAVAKLYLKDGTYHLVREWKREGDRVKFYSTERSDWEEIPVDLVDLRKTEAEMAEQKEALAEEAKTIGEEKKAVRAESDEIRKIPIDAGVYSLDDRQQLRIFPQADTKIHTSKGRTALKIATGLGILNGKGTVEIDQPHSATIVTNDRQEFFFQLAKEETFGIIKLTPHHNVRVVERLTIAPQGIDQTAEELDEVPSFKKQLTEGGLYKIWPEKPLLPGEYALVEFTPGKVEPRIWDFQFKK
jgi:hypothetical protein